MKLKSVVFAVLSAVSVPSFALICELPTNWGDPGCQAWIRKNGIMGIGRESTKSTVGCPHCNNGSNNRHKTMPMPEESNFNSPKMKGVYPDGTQCEFGGRLGQVVLQNDSPYTINFKLWHPDSMQIHKTVSVQGNSQSSVGFNVGDDWGIQLGSSSIRCIGQVSEWNGSFVVSSSNFN